MQGVYVVGVLGVIRDTPSPTPFQPRAAARLHFPQIKIDTLTATDTPTPTPRPAPLEWYDYPVLPTVSDRAREVYGLGLTLGNNPVAFSVIGDCEAIPARFFGVFDSNPPNYRLGEYAYLQATIDRFRGNFSRISRAAHDSFTTSSVLSPLWAHPAYCVADEPLSMRTAHQPPHHRLCRGRDDGLPEPAALRAADADHSRHPDRTRHRPDPVPEAQQLGGGLDHQRHASPAWRTNTIFRCGIYGGPSSRCPRTACSPTGCTSPGGTTTSTTRTRCVTASPGAISPGCKPSTPSRPD